MKKCRLWSAAGLVLLLAVSSCTKLEDEGGSVSAQQGEPVDVGFSMTVRSLSAGDEATYPLLQAAEPVVSRTIPGTIVDNENALVKNLWVIQFEDGITGNAGDKKMVGVPRFISSSDLSGQNGTVQLIGTTNPCYIIWVANHYEEDEFKWNLPLNATMADVAAKVMQLTAESDTWPTIDGVPTIMMNAITNTSVEGGSGNELTPIFYRNYARVSLKLTIDDAATDYKVTSVRLRNVPKNVTLSELALGSAYTGIVQSDADIYPYGSPLMDYPAVAPAAGNLDAPNETETFTWYVPRNQQGTSTASVFSDKSYYAPINATYFEVIAQRKSDSETAVFRVYPGANQVNDYTLLPNHAYTSGLNVVGIGDSSSPDSRVENFDDVVHTEAANSYILNPAPAGGRTRKYTIPITNAVLYWSGNKAGYGNLPANVISGSDPWQVSVLWSDLVATTNLITFDNTGQGVGPDGTFTLNVPAGLPDCNFTVQLTRQGQSTVLWSWHFWVTSYNPDAFNFSSINTSTANPGGIPNGQFTYPVPNGQVERYSGTIWSGAYSNRVMMDRPLGAVVSETDNYFTTQPVTTTTYTTTTRGHMHYQFGRKDPFPSVTANAAGEAQLSFGKITIRNAANSPGTSDSQVPMAQAVLNPTMFYNRTTTGGQWCSDADGYAAPTYVWHDPEALGSISANVEYATKSIYDPCPPGWKVPALGVWDDFSITNGTIQNAARDLGWESGRGVNNVNATRYWPGTTNSPVGGTIYYATSGYRSSNSGAVSGSGTYGYAWAAVPYSAANGRYLNFNGGAVYPQNNSNRAYGFPVRCVAESR